MIKDDILYDNEYDKIKELLIGHSIKKVNENTLELDNGTELEFELTGDYVGTDYGIEVLNESPNVITKVEIDMTGNLCYQIFVFAEDTRIKLTEINIYDDEYYGVGFMINVRPKEIKE